MINYEELWEKAWKKGQLITLDEHGEEFVNVSFYEQALQSYLSDKIIIPKKMVEEAREDYFEKAGTKYEEWEYGCFFDAKPSCFINTPVCRLCKLLTEAARGDRA